MMAYSTMTYEVKDNVGYVHFSRPEGANAVNPAFCSDLKNVMLEIESDDDVRSVAVTAEGKVFCAGGDLKEFHAAGSDLPEVVAAMLEDLHDAIYKMNAINFLIVKFLVRVKFANIINIINQKEIIPELIQNECNAKEIFRSVVYFLKNPELMNKQINDVSNTLNQIKSKTSSSAEASAVVLNYLDV